MSRLFQILLFSAVITIAGGTQAHAQALLGAPIGNPIGPIPESLPPIPNKAAVEEEGSHIRKSNENLTIKQVTAQKENQADEKLKQQVELLEKQIATQQKMILLLMDNMKKQSVVGVEKLETQVTTLDSRSKQAAQRDVELSQAVDKITEQRDADQRYGPNLPAGLKELFLPSGNTETTLSIYGALAFGYSSFIGNSATSANGTANGPGRPLVPGGFYFGEFTPDFLVKVNDWIFLEAEIGVGSDGSVGVGSFAQADFIINDWLTIIGGRFVAPIGWYNERLNNPWINKLPGDAPGSGPLLWQQVLPPVSLLGVQATGAFYLGNSPFKMEYAAYVSNGLNFSPADPNNVTYDDYVNLESLTNTFNIVNNNKALGGRVGLWWPEKGLEAGFSALQNTDWVAGFTDTISLWALDFNYHKDNWDVRLEYGRTYQQLGSSEFDNTLRQGFNGQIAFRPRSLPNGILQKTEFVYRYGYVNIAGVDNTQLNVASYSTPVDVPVRRQQNEFGINYWFTPRLVIKFAFQLNDEPAYHLHDNQFITEMAWGW
jgi:hypothetical protein